MGRVAFALLPLSLLLVLAGGPVAASPEATFEYLYVEANEGGSTGGHAGIRFGPDTYHFQYSATNGFLEMSRVPSSSFLTEYALLRNRSIHVSRVGVSRETFDALHRGFDRRYLGQRKELRRLDLVRESRELLDAVVAGESIRLDVPAAGLFDWERPSPGALAELRSRIPVAKPALLAAAVSSAEAATPDATLAGTLEDELSARAARSLLEAGPSLERDAIRIDPDSSWSLSERDLEALRRVEAALQVRLVALSESRRPDWGTPFLVGMARLLVVRESIARAHLVFLDAFPDDATLRRPEGERWREVGPLLLERAQARFDAARADLLGADAYREMDYARLEAAANRLVELRRGVLYGEPIRFSRDRLRPQRSASSQPIQLAPLEASQLARDEEERLREALEDLHGYNVVGQNCVTAIFETIDAGLAGLVGSADEEVLEADSLARLGGRVRPATSLAFIPFVSSRSVRGEYRVLDSFVVSSDRNAKLAQMRLSEPDLWIHLRESNVLTSTIYARGRDDSLFFFFTEDAPVMRPLYGVVNLAVGLAGSAAGLLWAPFDRGELLLGGLRGALVSVPELFFFNIRKGSNDYHAPGAEPTGRGPERLK